MVIGMGNPKNAKRQFGATINDFSDGYEKRFMEPDKLTYMYVFDSDHINKEDSIVAPVHNNIVLPVLKEINGLINAQIYDCAHPYIRDGIDWATYHGPFFACNWEHNT